MENIFSFLCFIFIITVLAPPCTAAATPACRPTCGSIDLKYPFGTGRGCGSPRFDSYVKCSTGPEEELLLTTHTGSYPITVISYATSTLTITPPYMSKCNSMQKSPDNLGLDWVSPFQLGPSTFLLLSCPPPTSNLTVNDSPVCDLSSSHLCDSFYTCSAVQGIGLPLFPPSNTCCVYSPANFNSKGELDLSGLECDGYTSVVSLMDYPTDPTRWEYGVNLKYTNGAFDSYYIENKCTACESSGGVCGYSPPGDSFVCVCQNGVNTTTQCSNFMSNDDDQGVYWSTATSPKSIRFIFSLSTGFTKHKPCYFRIEDKRGQTILPIGCYCEDSNARSPAHTQHLFPLGQTYGEELAGDYGSTDDNVCTAALDNGAEEIIYWDFIHFSVHFCNKLIKFERLLSLVWGSSSK